MIEIDGSFGEGGGQIIRTSVALSALTGKPFRIFNIRAKRSPSGLKAQHLNAVKAVAELCNANVSELKVGTQEFEFIPKKIEAKTLDIDIGTAGATTLVLHALLPAALHAKEKIAFKIKGGTNNFMAPPIDNVLLVFLPMLKKFGANVNCKLIKRGYYPKGGGEIAVEVLPSDIKRIEIVERGKLLKINGIANASKQLEKAKVAHREADGAAKKLKKISNIEIKEEYCNTLSIGTSISLAAEFENTILGADSFGKLRKPAEKVGGECAEKLLKEISSNSCIDEHLADQLIPYLALWGGKIKASSISKHAKTNIWVAEKFLPVKFEIKENEITCKRLQQK